MSPALATSTPSLCSRVPSQHAMQRFAAKLCHDIDAVRNNGGQTEGQINRLKCSYARCMDARVSHCSVPGCVPFAKSRITANVSQTGSKGSTSPNRRYCPSKWQRHNGSSLPFRMFDKLPTIQPGTIVDNKRLSAVLGTVKACQAEYAPKRQRGHVARQRPPNNLDAVGLRPKGRAVAHSDCDGTGVPIAQRMAEKESGRAQQLREAVLQGDQERLAMRAAPLLRRTVVQTRSANGYAGLLNGRIRQWTSWSA